MKRIEIRDLHKTFKDFEGQTLTLCGWARTVRDSKNIAFIELNDGAFKSVQIVVERDNVKNYDEIVKQRVGASFAVSGKLILTPNAQQPFEINALSVDILGECAPDYPLQKKGHTMEFLRTLPTIRPRGNLFNAVFRIREYELGDLYLSPVTNTGDYMCKIYIGEAICTTNNIITSQVFKL